MYLVSVLQYLVIFLRLQVWNHEFMRGSNSILFSIKNKKEKEKEKG